MRKSQGQSKRPQPIELKKKQEVAFPINQLPTDILAHTFTFFTVKEQGSVLPRVCKLWNEVSSNNAVWKVVCEQEGIQDTVDTANTNAYKELYKSQSKTYYVPRIHVEPNTEIILDNKYEVPEVACVYSDMKDAVAYLLRLALVGNRVHNYILAIRIEHNQLSRFQIDENTMHLVNTPAFTLGKDEDFPKFPIVKVIHIPMSPQQVTENLKFKCKDGVKVEQEQYITEFTARELAFQNSAKNDVSDNNNNHDHKNCIIS